MHSLVAKIVSSVIVGILILIIKKIKRLVNIIKSSIIVI
jgi:hypothetical protein